MVKKNIIDAHTHMFPDDLPENFEWYAAQDDWFGSLTRYTPGDHVRECFANAEEGLACADAAGVETIVMQGWYWRTMDLCRRHNDYMARLIRDYPGRYEGYASINPKFGSEAVKEVERCYEMGFAGVGELGPGGDGFTLSDPGLYAVIEACADLHMPVNFHVGEPVGHVYKGKDLTPIEGFYPLAKRFPEAVFIFAHMGGGLPFYELRPEVHMAFKNVYYDLAANPLLYGIGSIRTLISLVGKEKIVFGTDFPLTIYPRKCMDQDLTLFINDIEENAGLSEDEWNSIMRGNMRALLDRSGKRHG